MVLSIMSFIIIDNTKNLANAEMTPLLINYFNNNNFKVSVISEPTKLVINNDNEIDGIILSGGPILLSQKTELLSYSKNFTALIEYPQIPILGICFGFQLMGVAYGGVVNGLLQNKKERIWEDISIKNNTGTILFKNFNRKIKVYQCHSDSLTKCPNDFIVTSSSDDNIIEAIECIEKLRFGVQFHPENSEDGLLVLDNFTDFCLNLRSEFM